MKNSSCRHMLKSVESKSCQECGSYVDPRSGVTTIKSQTYSDPHMISEPIFLSQLLRETSNFQQSQCIKLNPVVTQILEQLVNKFSFNLTTFARALYIFHQVLREKPQLQYQQLRYGTVCLYLAAKMTERYEDIPRVGKFIRQACKVFEKAEYVAIEEEVFEIVYDKVFEVSFFTDLLDYYRVKGVIFTNERIADPSKAETRINELALTYIKSGQFLALSQERLASIILYTVRQELNVSEIWNEHIEFYTRVNTYEIYNILKEMRRSEAKGSQTARKMILKHSISSVTSMTVLSPMARTSSTISSIGNSPEQMFSLLV